MNDNEKLVSVSPPPPGNWRAVYVGDKGPSFSACAGVGLFECTHPDGFVEMVPFLLVADSEVGWLERPTDHSNFAGWLAPGEGIGDIREQYDRAAKRIRNARQGH